MSLPQRLQRGQKQFVILYGVDRELWLDGSLRTNEDWAGGHGYEHKETYAWWIGTGCMVDKEARNYFVFSTRREESLWILDLEPTLLLPVSLWPKDPRYDLPKIVEGKKKELVQWLIKSQIKMPFPRTFPLPLPNVEFKPLSFKEAVAQGFVYTEKGQAGLVLA